MWRDLISFYMYFVVTANQQPPFSSLRCPLFFHANCFCLLSVYLSHALVFCLEAPRSASWSPQKRYLSSQSLLPAVRHSLYLLPSLFPTLPFILADVLLSITPEASTCSHTPLPLSSHSPLLWAVDPGTSILHLLHRDLCKRPLGALHRGRERVWWCNAWCSQQVRPVLLTFDFLCNLLSPQGWLCIHGDTGSWP